MPRAASTQSAAPFAKLVNLGDKLQGAWAGSLRRQANDYDTKKPAFKRDDPTKPVLEEVNWFVAMPDTIAQTGNVLEDALEPITPGDIVRYTFAGFKWGQAIEQRKALPKLEADGVTIGAGREASSDVYTIELIGWSAETSNAAAAEKAGFTVADGRIILRTEEERERYVVAQVKRGGNANPARDLSVTVRRIDLPAEQKWADLADDLYDSAPWDKTDTPAAAPTAPAATEAVDYDDEEEDDAPF